MTPPSEPNRQGSISYQGRVNDLIAWNEHLQDKLKSAEAESESLQNVLHEQEEQLQLAVGALEHISECKAPGHDCHNAWAKDALVRIRGSDAGK